MPDSDYAPVSPQDGYLTRLVTGCIKATRVYDQRQLTPLAQRDKTRLPEPAQTQPVGILNSGALPDCECCAQRLQCAQRQSANYYARRFIFSFARYECEAALNGKVDILAILEERPRTMAQLHVATGRSYASLSRDLRACGAHIIAYGTRGEAIYGAHAAATPCKRLEIRDLILLSLKDQGPQTTGELSANCHAHISTIRKLVRALRAGNAISEIGKRKFAAANGIVRQAPIWQINDDIIDDGAL